MRHEEKIQAAVDEAKAARNYDETRPCGCVFYRLIISEFMMASAVDEQDVLYNELDDALNSFFAHLEKYDGHFSPPRIIGPDPMENGYASIQYTIMAYPVRRPSKDLIEPMDLAFQREYLVESSINENGGVDLTLEACHIGMDAGIDEGEVAFVYENGEPSRIEQFTNKSGAAITQEMIDKSIRQIYEEGTGTPKIIHVPLNQQEKIQKMYGVIGDPVDHYAESYHEVKCECGAEKAQTTHSHWCPKHE